MSDWPITYQDVLDARERISSFVTPSPLRNYPLLDQAIGNDISVFVKHENLLPTGAFKIRNGLSALSALSDEERKRGVIGATRGNHGQGLALAGKQLGIPVVIVVPLGNNPEKNEAMRSYGIELIEEGKDYDECLEVVDRLIKERGLTLIHSTNNNNIIAGAGTATLEICEQLEEFDAMVAAVGGGSISVGAMTVLRELRPDVKVFAVQAANASATHDSWHAREPRTTDSANTIADGLAVRSSYEGTFGALQNGLEDFITITEEEIAEALRLAIRTTHTMVEPSAVASLAGLIKLRDQLAGKRVVIIFSGANIDSETLRRIMNKEL